MSMIGEQVNKLRYQADIYNTIGSAWELNRAESKKLQEMLREAANTIEFLSAKLQAVNMERSAEDCGGWIPCKERFPEEKINPVTDDFYEYEVTFKQGDVTDVRHYKFGRRHWRSYGMILDEYVIAWREPLEPYHET